MTSKISQRRFSTRQHSNDAGHYLRQTWLAGLGAVSRVREEGSRLFQNLVQEGEAREAKGRKIVEAQLEDVVSRIDEAKSRSGETWDKLERIFQQRVERALNRLNVPTGDDVRELADRIEKLAASMADVTVEAKRSTPRRSTVQRQADRVTRAADAVAAQADVVRSAA
jgi:poly(hydroxyalkanoate) granule-associated protein